jgi:hypothetical protein
MRINEISENISHTSKRLRDIEREKKVKPGTDEWFKLWFSLPYLKEAKENIYDILEPEDCGPFDGGCVLVAQALQKIHGGDIVVLINDRGNADHAAVKIGNTLLDFDGPLPVDKFVKRFEKNEHVKITGIRPMKDSDLPEATRNQTLLPKIINLLSKGVKEAFSSEPDPAGYQQTALTNPQYTIIVNTPGELDWYKLGQHFANLGHEDPHEYGQAESDMMIVAPNKEQLLRYMQELDRLGAEYKLVGGSHEHPEIHAESNVFTNARMNAIKAGKTEFKVGSKTYKVTGDTKDEKEAVANLAEETGKEMLKIFRGMHHDAGMNKDMDRFILSNDWELRDFTPDMFPSEEEFFDYDDPFDRIIDIDYSHRVNLSAPIIVGPQFSDGKYSVIDGNHRAAAAQRMGKTIKAYFPVKKTTEARTFQPQMSPMQDLVAEYQMFSSFGQMGLSDYAKSSDSAEKIKEVIRTLAQSNKNLQNLDKQALEKNKNKILTHIHDMMNYAIAHFREHLKPEQFDAKKQQINKLLTKYNNITSTNENIIREQPDSKNYLLQLERDKRAGMLILHILDKNTGKRTEVRGKMGYETNGYDPNDKLHQLLDKVGKSASVSDLMNGDVVSINPRHPDGASAKAAADTAYNENFADGKNPGRKGLSKRMGVNTKASVSSLRKTAKNSSGEKQRMAHWLANMKAGREK